MRLEIGAAQEFRSKGAALARAKTEGFAYVYFGTCITLGTRIRIEVFTYITIKALFTQGFYLYSP